MTSKSTSHMAHTHTERHRGWQQLGPKTPNKNSFRRVQVKFKTTTRPSSKNMQLHYNNMLWSSAAGVFHMAVPSFHPLAATSLDHHDTLVEENPKNVQVTYKNVQDKQKTEQWKLWTSWTAKPRQQLSNESTWVQLNANDITLGTSSNSWHQLHNSENEHHMSWYQKKLELPKLYYKHPNSFFFPSNAFMASARSFNTFNCMLQIRFH